MKRVKVYLALLMLSAYFLSSAVANTNECLQGPTLQKVKFLRCKVQPAGRPNAPSRVFIECTYGDGGMEFTFPEGVETLTVQISNEGETLTFVATSEEPRFEIPVLTGEYAIQCTTDDGRVFAGVIEF